MMWKELSKLLCREGALASDSIRVSYDNTRPGNGHVPLYGKTSTVPVVVGACLIIRDVQEALGELTTKVHMDTSLLKQRRSVKITNA